MIRNFEPFEPAPAILDRLNGVRYADAPADWLDDDAYMACVMQSLEVWPRLPRAVRRPKLLTPGDVVLVDEVASMAKRRNSDALLELTVRLAVRLCDDGTYAGAAALGELTERLLDHPAWRAVHAMAVLEPALAMPRVGKFLADEALVLWSAPAVVVHAAALSRALGHADPFVRAIVRKVVGVHGSPPDEIFLELAWSYPDRAYGVKSMLMEKAFAAFGFPTGCPRRQEKRRRLTRERGRRRGG